MKMKISGNICLKNFGIQQQYHPMKGQITFFRLLSQEHTGYAVVTSTHKESFALQVIVNWQWAVLIMMMERPRLLTPSRLLLPK
jgi:hypothetical protein